MVRKGTVNVDSFNLSLNIFNVVFFSGYILPELFLLFPNCLHMSLESYNISDLDSQ